MGPWDVVALQEAADYVQHPAPHASFVVASFTGCAILFNRNRFECHVGSKHLHVLANTGFADSTLGVVVVRGILRGPMRSGRNHCAINTCASRSAICINVTLMIRKLDCAKVWTI